DETGEDASDARREVRSDCAEAPRVEGQHAEPLDERSGEGGPDQRTEEEADDESLQHDGGWSLPAYLAAASTASPRARGAPSTPRLTPVAGCFRRVRRGRVLRARRWARLSSVFVPSSLGPFSGSRLGAPR